MYKAYAIIYLFSQWNCWKILFDENWRDNCLSHAIRFQFKKKKKARVKFKRDKKPRKNIARFQIAFIISQSR